MTILSTSLQVSDLEASKTFYIDGLELDVHQEYTDDTGTVHTIIGGDEDTELELLYDPESSPPEKSFGTVINDDGTQTLVVPVLHISLVIQEPLEEVFERVVERTDCTVIQEPVTEVFDGGSTQISFIEDPDGYPLELNHRTGPEHPLPK